MSEDNALLKITGMGPFKLPGEAKSHKKAVEKAKKMLKLADEAKNRGN